MRLAIIRRRYNPYGGAERFIERLLAHLNKRGIKNTIITEDWSGPNNADGTECLRIQSSGFTRAARFKSFQKSVHTVLNQETAAGRQFDLIQSHEQ